MATMEFWIQIESSDRTASSKKDEYHSEKGLPATTGPTWPLDEKTLPNETEPPKKSALLFTQSDDHLNRVPPNDGNELFLRWYKPPQYEDWRDAWTIPEESCTDASNVNTDGTARISGPAIECKAGDRIIVHFRNNDQRKQIITRMVEVAIPFGGLLQLPTPFNEPLPVADRTHKLTPHSVDGSLPYCRDKIVSFPGPRQTVGSEAAHWNKVGIKTFKKASRVPPGGTYTYIWNIPVSPKSQSSDDVGTTRLVVLGECYSSVRSLNVGSGRRKRY